MPALAGRLAYITLVLVIGLCNGNCWAQTNLQLSLTAPTAPQASGKNIEVRVLYRCASTTQAAQNATLRIKLPATLEYQIHGTSAHIASSNYNTITRELTYTFNNPLAAGTTGQVTLQVQFPNGITPNGRTASVVAVFDADNATSVTESVQVTASATQQFSILKQRIAGGAVASPLVFQVRICSDSPTSSYQSGVINVTNAVVTDYLPAGVSFHRFISTNTGITRSYNPTTRNISWSLGAMALGECHFEKFIVQYENSHFSANQVVTNTALANVNYGDGSTSSHTTSETVILETPRYTTVTTKNVQDAVMISGGYGNYGLRYQNDGTSTQTDSYLEDILPYATEFTSISLGKWSQTAGTRTDYLSFHYRTNFQPWKVHQTNIEEAADPKFTLADLGLTLGGAEYVTGIRIGIGDATVNTNNYTQALLDFRIRPGTPPGVITNCATGVSSSPATHTPSCADITITNDPSDAGLHAEPIPRVWKTSAISGPVSPGQLLKFQARVSNSGYADLALEGSKAYTLLPIGVDFVPSSQAFWTEHTGMGTPIMTAESNYKGTNRTLLKWVWPNGANTIAPGTEHFVYWDVTVNAKATPGAYTLKPEFVMGYDNPAYQVRCQEEDIVDVFDFDDNGDSSEVSCGYSFGISVNSIVALSSQLSVKGALDNDYLIFPDVGNTTPGGLADYKLVVRNEGNVDVTNVKLLDILPSIGDVSVVTGSARDTKWRPSLTGPVEAPTGVLVFYSTAQNPCRAAQGLIDTDPVGCEAPNWSLTLPDDLSTVSSLYFDFGAAILANGEVFELSWPMRTPTTVLSTANAGDAAWNSIGFVADRADDGSSLLATEPFKTGITVAPLQPGVVGDFVWSDTNGNGRQDSGEPGLGNVRVELYEDDGNGTADPLTDALVSFTNTNSDGSYLFPALPAANYFVVCFLPPSFGLSPKQSVPNSSVDSDASLLLLAGQEVGMTSIFPITNSQQDFTQDIGLVPTGLSAISDYVWLDADEDGTQNEGANAGINGVTLLLLDLGGSVITSTTSRNGRFNRPGYYEFDNLNPGNYRIQVGSPTQFNLVAKGSGSDSDSDSDANSVSRFTDVITLGSNQTLTDYDFGVVALPGEICTNGIDDDGDGLVDCEDEDCPNSNAVVRVNR